MTMKDILADLAAYHFWADKRLLDALRKLPADACTQELQSSFPSLRETVAHMLQAESTWLQRLQMKEKPVPLDDLPADIGGLADRLLEHNEALHRWVLAQNPSFFEHVIAYYSLQKQYYKTPVYQCLLQLLNHATYHRGQIVTMLHQLGVSKIPGTDYILFKRSVKKGSSLS
jgi:uncharacterized damage-inducible protein DinB